MNKIRIFWYIVFFLISISVSNGQIFTGYLISIDRDSINSEFKIDNYSQNVVDMVSEQNYSFYETKLLYDEYNNVYYRAFNNPETNEYEIFKVSEEGEYSYYEGTKNILLKKDSLLVFFPLTYGYNQNNYVKFLGQLNYVFDQKLVEKDFYRIIDDKGYIKYGKFLEFTKRFNGEIYDPRFRSKGKIKPQIYVEAGYSSQILTNVRFPGYEKKNTINSFGFLGYSVVGKLVLRRMVLGFGYSSVNATIKAGRYNKIENPPPIRYLNVVDDVNYKFNRAFTNVGYRFGLSRVGLQPFVQLNYATISTSDTVKVNRQIQQLRTEGTPLLIPDIYNFTDLILSVGFDVYFSITTRSLLNFEVITDLNSVEAEDVRDDVVMGFRNILGLNIRYVYKFN